MKRGGVVTRDWFIVLAVALPFIFAAYTRFPLLVSLEHAAYDMGVTMTHRASGAAEDIAIVAIDEDSLRRHGRWPWPRSVLADVLQTLSSGRPRAIALQASLTNPQTYPGLDHIRKIRDYVKKTDFPRQARRQERVLRGLLWRAEQELDMDAILGRAIPKAGNAYLPLYFVLGKAADQPGSALPGYIRQNRIRRIVMPDNEAPPNGEDAEPVMNTYVATEAHYPLPAFGKPAAGIGHLNYPALSDGGARVEALLIRYRDEYYPSFALVLAAAALGLDAGDIRVTPGEGVQLGKLKIDTDSRMRMYGGFYRAPEGEKVFATYPFSDVETRAISPKVFRNKIVLVGPTAESAAETVVTPINAAMPAVERTAHVVTSLLNADFYARPTWALFAEAALYVLVLGYLMFLFPNISQRLAGSLTFGLFVALVAAGHYLMISEKIWVRTLSPALLLMVGYTVVSMKRFYANQRRKREAETDSAHSNRMLGLSFQAQGQLDMAMDKFRKLPVDKSVLELIYNLALDYERKRQFGKAGAAYDYILEHDRRFRDVKDRKKRALHVDGTLIIGNPGGSMAATLILDPDHKPTLGRYQVERELGRGAMGTVYLGSDPKINRVVAIKTLALSQEFEGNALTKVKERFFREAETAGRLNHPNIVTIYDAGEEHDLAYIAMEYLQGKDLTNFISRETLLPVDWVLDIVAHVADALDYAHKQDVVHRDIKPANIMYNEADDTVKVTDFGIARITASSQTRTGVVLGTPSYMSPEQVAGKRVDGRSDLFSLGVTMFELLTGEQPFTGDSMAALMYQITNKKHPDINRVRGDLPGCIKGIIDRALQKEPEKRFQSGEELRMAIDKCLDKL